MERREFIHKSALAAAGVAAVVSGVFQPETILAQKPASDGWTASLKSLTAHEGETLLRMSRQIYPHDRLADSSYAKVAQDLDAEAQAAPDVARLLHEGLASLDQGEKKFVDLSPQQQLEALKRIENSPFFQKVRSTEVVSLYNSPEVWKQFGYAGSSYEIGGYLKHGFDDLKWLPDPPESASPKPAQSSHR